MTDALALTAARNQYISALDGLLKSHEWYLFLQSIDCYEDAKEKAISERDACGLAVKSTLAEYVKVRDAWDAANRETTP